MLFWAHIEQLEKSRPGGPTALASTQHPVPEEGGAALQPEAEPPQTTRFPHGTSAVM
jgi:hypothetical protein